MSTRLREHIVSLLQNVSRTLFSTDPDLTLIQHLNLHRLSIICNLEVIHDRQPPPDILLLSTWSFLFATSNHDLRILFRHVSRPLPTLSSHPSPIKPSYGLIPKHPIRLQHPTQTIKHLPPFQNLKLSLLPASSAMLVSKLRMQLTPRSTSFHHPFAQYRHPLVLPSTRCFVAT